MRAIVNLKHEPRLREDFEYAQVVNTTVLIDRRTKWGKPPAHSRSSCRKRVKTNC